MNGYSGDAALQHQHAQWRAALGSMPSQHAHNQDNVGFAMPTQPASRQYLSQTWTSAESITSQPAYLGYSNNFDLGPLEVDTSAIDKVSIDTLTKGLDAQPWNAAVAQFQPSYPVWQASSQLVDGSMRIYASHLGDQNSIQGDSEPPIDSGYGSVPAIENSHGYNPAQAMYKIPPAKKSRTSRASSAYDTSEDTSQVNGNRRSSSISPCQICGKHLHNKSDATKHAKAHERPYKCKVESCKYYHDGFGTPNDCARHMATRHGLYEPGAIRSGFICVLCPSTINNKRDKWWPRQDNFKAHLKRKHPECSFSEIIQQSLHRMRPDDCDTVMSGGASDYHRASHADSDRHYQDEYGQTMDRRLSRQTGLQNETMPWLDPGSHTQGEELAGVGHNADLAIASPGTYDTYDATTTFPDTGAMADQYETLPTDAGQSYQDSRAGEPAFKQECSASEHSNSRKRPRSPEESCSDDDGDEDHPLRCKYCGKEGESVRRECDMRKHEARHARRYGCTHPQCYAKHGSKSDWLRHEDRLHRVPESWLCRVSDGKGGYCHAFFRSEHDFKWHLDETHHIRDETGIWERTYSDHLPRAGRTRFWCGFCRDVIDNPNLNMPLSFRNEHVGKHMDLNGGSTIDGWVCPELQKPKQSITEEDKRRIRNAPTAPRVQVKQKQWTDSELDLLTGTTS